MTSMTYGTMPTPEEFEAAFDRECPRGTYAIRLGSSDSRAVDGFRLGDGEWKAADLYAAIVEIVWKYQTDEPIPHSDCDVTSADLTFGPCTVCGRDAAWATDGAMSLVSVILDSLGFEWV